MPRLPLVMVLLGATRAVASPRAVEVRIDGTAPFAANELESALRVRLGDRGVHVRVHATEDGVAIDTGGSERDVPLAGRMGADAARLVALAAVDLVLPDLAESSEDPQPPSTRRPIMLTVLGGAAMWGGTLTGGSVDVSTPLGGARVALEVGAAELVGGPLSLNAAIVRGTVGLRRSVFELRAGVTAEPISVADGRGDTTVLVGGGASVRLVLPLASQVSVIFALGVDAFATQTQYTRTDLATVTTPWVAPWFSAGLAATL